jgi:type IV secretion system protein TrbL
MSWLRSETRTVGLLAALAGLLLVAQPSPTTARANVVCDVGGAAGIATGGVTAITGAIVGGGNPVSDVCNEVSDAVGGVVKNPVTDALKGIGNGIFEQITGWVSEGAAWLIGEVVEGIEETTTPQLTAKGFVDQYAKMATIAALLGMAMLLLAVIEGVAQGNSAMLVRVVLVNLPLGFIATSVAYIVVQLLVVATDGLCEAITSATERNSQRFFEGAIKGLGNVSGAGSELAGGGANPTGEAAGKTAVPLFVTFLAAIIGAFAAFLVWIELIMRDAAVYVVALFLPFSLAASVWPRWMGALRRTVELLLVVISSKFVIVSIIALAAGMLADPGEGVEPILAASALMLIACFAPFVLFKFVPFAEGAMTAAYSRRSAAGGGITALQVGSDVAILRGMFRSNMGGGDSGVALWDAGGKGGGGGSGMSAPRPGGGSPGGGVGKGGGAGGAAAGGSAGAAAGVAAAAPVAASRGASAAAERMEGVGGAKDQTRSSGASGASGAQPSSAEGSSGRGAEGGGTSAASERPPRPAPEPPGAKPERGER